MYILIYTTLKKIPALDLDKGESVAVSQLSKCASLKQVLSFLGFSNKEGHGLEDFYSDPLELNEQIAVGDFHIVRKH